MDLKELLKRIPPGSKIISIRNMVIETPGGQTEELTVTSEVIGDAVISRPKKGHYPISNMYVDAATGKVVIEYDNTPAENGD